MGPVLGTLGEDTPVVSYDRPGVGGSAAIEGVVGHSWGGTLSLDYATRFAGEVVGSVYVDPTNVHTTPAQSRQMFRDLGASEPELLALEARMEADEEEMLARMPPGLVAEWRFVLHSMRVDAAEWVPAQPSIPTSILLAGRLASETMEGDGLPPSVDPEAFFRAERALTRRQFEARMAGIPGASVRVVDGAGHALHRDAPAVVAEEIRRVIALAQKR